MQIVAKRAPEFDALSAYLARIFDDSFGDAAHIAVAVSGGADSMALCLLAKAWCQLHAKKLTALTVDHRLRPESTAEARQVARWMKQHGIAHHILAATPREDLRNIQTRARQMRYDAMLDWCSDAKAPTLLLAHHFDDQAETVALQKHRGTNPASRAGMALVSLRGELRMVRPLLGVRKMHLIAMLESMGIAWIEDPSNQTDQYARNRLRRILSEASILELWEDAKQAGARRYEEDCARAEWLARNATSRHSKQMIDLRAWYALEEERRTDILSHAIRIMGGKDFRPRHHETLRLDARVLKEPAGKATLGHCIIRWQDDMLVIEPERTLAPVDSRAYMTPANTPKPLGNAPFWWFNYSPYNDGATRAPSQ